MRRYELMVMISDLIDEDAFQATLERIRNVLSKQEGTVVDEADWGKRPLAYEINKRTHAYYAVFDVEITREGLDEVERQLKLNDDVVRFKSVRPMLRIHKSKSA